MWFVCRSRETYPLHVTPRMSNMPAGNIPLTLLVMWNRSLQRVGLRRACSDEEVGKLALKMRFEFERLESARVLATAAAQPAAEPDR